VQGKVKRGHDMTSVSAQRESEWRSKRVENESFCEHPGFSETEQLKGF
jgi:hypothetical protein